MEKVEVMDLILSSSRLPEMSALQDMIKALETKLLLEEQIDIKLTHHFSKDLYAREMFMPKGTLLVGKMHKFKNMNIVSSGEVSFLSIDGVTRVRAPHSFVASPGAKRVIYAHEDTVWTTIHGTNKTDLVDIEDEVIARDYSEVTAQEINDLKGEL